MALTYAARQLALAALTANALRPLGGRYGSVPAFAAGWLTSELAPQLLSLSVADTATQIARARKDDVPTRTIGIAASVAAVAGLGWIIRGAMQAGPAVEATLRETLGADYLDRLEEPVEVSMRSGLREVARPFKLVGKDIEVIRNLNYRRGGSRARLDIYRPQDRELRKAPVLVQIHGGGWTIGDKRQQGLLLMDRMARRGWVCVAPNYRLAPKHPFPAQIDDVRTALEWVKEHIEEYGGDPSYVVVTGGSAGGHLAALAALTEPGIAACVPFYGVYDMANLTEDRFAKSMRDWYLAPRVFKRSPKDHLDDFVQASPLAHVGPDSPDFFVIHGTNDTLVNVGQARAFVQALREKSDATVTYSELPGTQHAFEVFGSIRSHHVIKAVERWLEWHRAVWNKERRQPASSPA